MKKKIMVLLMACILAQSMSTAVFAAGSSKLTITALCREPVIKITVLASGEVYLNPKRLSLVINGEVDDGQIINTAWGIENESECALSVNASVYATVNSKSTMALCSSSLVGSTTRLKKAFIYLDKRVTDPGTDLESLDWDQTVYDNSKHLLITTGTRERSGFITLAGAGEDGEALPGSVGAFKLCGDAVSNPREEWDPAVDNIAVNIAFTFRPTALTT